mmetsp:Transcript_13737/g.34834  ORF Transcript_13737/g.34834 Transcript_13737/m.34834 type:complete len:218 (-) Transcript_13737:3-656(-)
MAMGARRRAGDNRVKEAALSKTGRADAESSAGARIAPVAPSGSPRDLGPALPLMQLLPTGTTSRRDLENGLMLSSRSPRGCLDIERSSTPTTSILVASCMRSEAELGGCGVERQAMLSCRETPLGRSMMLALPPAARSNCSSKDGLPRKTNSSGKRTKIRSAYCRRASIGGCVAPAVSAAIWHDVSERPAKSPPLLSRGATSSHEWQVQHRTWAKMA